MKMTKIFNFFYKKDIINGFIYVEKTYNNFKNDLWHII